jgi:LacI family transcriptional regulator
MTRPRTATCGLFTATINDVAARAGVSKRTVSRVMNEEPNITADTRARVMKVVQRLGYRPNPAARRLASGKSHLIGLFHSVCTPPDAALVEQVALAMASERYRVLVCSSEHRSPNAAEELASLARVVPIDGAILCAPLSEQLAFAPAFHAQRIPCVRIGSSSGLHGVSSDDREAARQMTRYLASVGHQRIGFICGLREHDNMEQRRQGYLDGLQMAGLPVDTSIILQGADTFASGVECGHRLLRDATRRPTSIFASTDTMATGILRAANELGIPVPAALSVAGFGDQPLASQLWPALTTVRPPIRALADRAAAVLLGLLRGDSASRNQSPIPSAEIILRDSTRPRGHSSWRLTGPD